MERPNSPLGMQPKVQEPSTRLPDPSESRLFGVMGMSRDEADRIAKSIAEAHKRGKEARLLRDLTAEKYLINIDGEGDGQWAELFGGREVRVPPNPGGGLRLSMNLLKPVCNNVIAHHTAQLFQVNALSRKDRASRDQARINTLLANDVLRRQHVNVIVGDAQTLALPYGSCPVHFQWRHDTASDPYEPVYTSPEQVALLPGKIDVWTGSPWGTVYNPGAKRHSIHWVSYERTLPAALVRMAFDGAVPWLSELEGDDKMPSASVVQRILRNWTYDGWDTHGTAVVHGQGSDELVALVCQELLPGLDPNYPDGWLRVVALSGKSQAPGRGGSGIGKPMLLHDGPLPGKVLSLEVFYADQRGDDVLGRPWVTDMVVAQKAINQYITLEAEFIRRFSRPPFKMISGTLEDDSILTADDALLEVTDPNGFDGANFLYPPVGGAGIYSGPIDRWTNYLYTAAGWQSASRGESKSGDPTSKVALLAQMDDTIHAPIQQGIRRSIVRLCQGFHAIARQYMDIPWVVSVTGDDMSYLAEPFIHKDQLSPEPPDYEVVSGYGATPEQQTQKLLQYATMRGADGQPFLSTEEFWRMNPDQVRRPTIETTAIRENRVQAINYDIQTVVRAIRQVLTQQASMMPPQAVQMAEQQLQQAAFQKIMERWPIMRDDNPQMHIEGLGELTQDHDLDPMVGRVASMRMDMYYQWMQMMQAQMMPAAQPVQALPAGPQGDPQGPPN